MGWSAQYFTTIIIEGDTPQTGIFIYGGTPGNGTLIGSWAAQAGQDAFGNTYPAGINVFQGQLTGVSINQSTATALSILSSVMTNSVINNTQFNQGQIFETTIIFDSNGGQLLAYTNTSTTFSQNSNGTYTYTAPAGITQGAVSVWGASAGGDGGNTSEGGNAGGASEYSGEPSYPLTALANYQVIVGNGGNPSTTGNGHGSDGSQSSFDFGGSNGGVVANPGLGNGTGGTGSTNSAHFDGGDGGGTSGNGGGASGGNSGSPTAAGFNGLASTSNSGASAPAAQANSGNGGHGGALGANGANGGAPGGGGGGAGQGTSNQSSLTKTYTPVWTGSYIGPDGGSPNAGRSNSTMYQGGETSGGGSINGNQRWAAAFNRAAMAADFAGFTLTNATLTVSNQHTWFNSGMTILFDEFAGLGSSAPGSYPAGAYQDTWASATIAEGATHAFGVPLSVANRLLTSSNGLGMGHNVAGSFPYNLSYYGFFSGGSSIKLTLTGQTTTAGSTTSGAGADGHVNVTTTTAQVLESALSPLAGTDANGNAYAAGYTGPVNVFHPGSAPSVVETWHTLTLANGWAAQGFARYKLIGYNTMLLELQINDNAATSGTFAVMPSGYSLTTSQFFPVGQFANVAATPGQVWICQIATGGGANMTILNWSKQSKQFMGNYIVSLD